MASEIVAVGEVRPACGRGVLFPADGGAGPRSFGVTIRGHEMEPEYMDGDVLVCDPDQQPFAGDAVLIVRKEGNPFFAYLAQDLISWPISRFGCTPLDIFEVTNPPHRFMMDEFKMRGMCKVVGKGIPED